MHVTNEYSTYRLTEESENIIPYLSKKKSVLGILLVAIKKNKNQVFLHLRKKRPFYNKLSLPGGRFLFSESIKQATKRIVKKYNINCEFEKVNSISLEHVTKNNKILHSFFLILVTAKTSDKINYTNIRDNKNKIIKSDYNLIKNDLNKQIEIKELFTDA